MSFEVYLGLEDKFLFLFFAIQISSYLFSWLLFSLQDNSTKDETMGNAAAKKGDSDTEEDEQETQQKDKGLSNKKKKVSNVRLLTSF